MKIRIEAYLYAPGLLQFIGGVNPVIVTGVFDKHLSVEAEAKLKYQSVIKHKGIPLQVRKIQKSKKHKKIFTCDGHLPSVSVHFFKKLKKAGWIIKKEAKTTYDFPSNKRDEELKLEIKRHKDQTRRILRAQKHCEKTCKRVVRKLSKQMFPFKNFPQVH